MTNRNDQYFYMAIYPSADDHHFFWKTNGVEVVRYFRCWECGKEHLYTGEHFRFCDVCGKPHPVILSVTHLMIIEVTK